MKVAEPVDRGLLPLLCLPTPAVKVTVTCNRGNNAQQQLILILFCADLLLSSHLDFLFVSPCSLFQAAGGVTIGLLAFGFCPVCSCWWPVNLWMALCRRSWRKMADRSKSVSAAVFGLVWRKQAEAVACFCGGRRCWTVFTPVGGSGLWWLPVGRLEKKIKTRGRLFGWRKESGQPNGWGGWFVWGEGLRVCVRLATVGKKKIKREGLCVVGWQRKRRWVNGVEAEGSRWRWSGGPWLCFGRATTKDPGWRCREKNSSRGRRRLWFFEKRIGLGLGFLWFRVFCVFLFLLQNCPPPFCLSCGPVFIGKMLHGSQNWSLNFLSFFVNLIFLNFFVFLKASKYQHRLNVENQWF